MENRSSLGPKFSKYALSNILKMLSLKEALRMRIVSKKFDAALLVALNVVQIDYIMEEDRYQYLLDTCFDDQTKNKHQVLSTKELAINKNLKENLKKAGKGSNLFKNYKELSYLKRPNSLIEKPIFAVLILVNKLPKVKTGIDYMLKEDLDQLWFKCRDKLKDGDFIKRLEDFDIRSVTQYQIKQI